MKNNSLGTVTVSNTKRPRARFNLSADLHTSMDFGSVIPARVHLQVPNSKVVCSSRERILCSPMLAPTMGRLGLKAYHNFVRLSDLTENVAPMMAQEAVSRGPSQFVPVNVPKISIRDLSFFVLFGAYCNIYKCASDDTGDTEGCTASVYSGTSGDLNSDADLSALGLLNKNTTVIGVSAFILNIAKYFYGSLNSHYIPLGNPNNATFYPIDPSCAYYEANKDWYDLSDVTPANADYVLPVSLVSGQSTDTYYLCFRLSDFGKRLRKILIGCGYQIDFDSSEPVSMLPLFAFYKTYFDVFGLTLYTNWEQTLASRFLRSCDLVASPDFTSFWTTTDSFTNLNNASAFFFNFIIKELGLCYYTDEQDFVSAHTRSTAVSPSPSSFVASIDTDVDFNNSYNPNIQAGATSPSEPSGLTAPNGHAYINDVLHGQLDSELLKKLYRWTNRNTIAGRRIAELLRAQGLGSYVDECKSDFIGSFELPIDVFDGISNSDTFDALADSGAPLGERYGNGQASSSDDRNRANCERSFTFECNEFGYWVTLFVIVPKGGYTESLDPTVRATSKFQFYNPEFDSLGMELNPKSLVVASKPFSDPVSSSGSLQASFGTAPRYFSWKFGRNVANGDFTRRGVRDAFAPYYLDKVIDVGQRLVRPVTSLGPTVRGYTVVKTFKAVNLPIAGNAWRYPTRYPWIGHFNRIFNMVFASREHGANMDVSRQAEFEYFGASNDNFIVHAIFDVQYFAPMLPVEDSFETFDDENAPNSSMSKA